MLKLYSANYLVVEKCDSTRMIKNLSEWLDFTKTPIGVRRDITSLFVDDLEGISKTGFQPYQTDEGICFNHKWTMIIGRKPQAI